MTGVLIAFVLGLLISNSIGLITAFAPGVCAFGTIQDSGSTSFYALASKEVQKYGQPEGGSLVRSTLDPHADLMPYEADGHAVIKLAMPIQRDLDGFEQESTTLVRANGHGYVRVFGMRNRFWSR